MSATMAFYPEPGSRVTCHDYGTERTPILNMWSAPVTLTLAGDDKLPLADHLAFARSLAAETAAYLAALERYAALTNQAA
ncbi:hypothetical protein AB0K43_15185 [Kitasatospora sp. NPDC049258]|uniref:hypothetical protein n=1 Tax=Kitasatospora sp. NPDC049258 TaxID=3155394 RepID=UPI003423B3DA